MEMRPCLCTRHALSCPSFICRLIQSQIALSRITAPSASSSRSPHLLSRPSERHRRLFHILIYLSIRHEVKRGRKHPPILPFSKRDASPDPILRPPCHPHRSVRISSAYDLIIQPWLVINPRPKTSCAFLLFPLLLLHYRHSALLPIQRLI